MAKHIYSLLLLLFVVSSCQTIEELSIDYMLPAEISFPSELRKVAIVNNVSTIPDKAFPQDIKTDDKKQKAKLRVTYPEGDSKLVVESLAKAIAEQNYFDEVVVCDSALRTNDLHARETTLSRSEVNDLARNLQVDFIMSLEDLQMKANRFVRFIPQWNTYWGTIDVKVLPTVKIYIPNRNGPMVTIQATDSIFWEEYGAEQIVNAKLISDSLMIREASEFAGSIPLKFMIPYWQSANRYLYSGESVDMRDAAFYARTDEWDKAMTTWKRLYDSTKSKKKQFRLSHNIALAYEMADQIEEAEKWARKSQELAGEIEKVDGEINEYLNIYSYPLSIRASIYLQEIKKRTDYLVKLKAQMGRFGDDF